MTARDHRAGWLSASWRRKQRRRCYEILERDAAQDRLAEFVNLALIILILANVLFAVLETVPNLLLHDNVLFISFEHFTLAIFAVEYFLRVWVAPENPRYRGLSDRRARLRYACSPAAIIDLIAWLPFVISLLLGGSLRNLATLRLLRFIKLTRYSPGMQSLIEALRSESQALVACFGLLGAAVLISASAMYMAEGAIQPDRLGSIPAAMWWSISTITTAGYGDVYPVTVLGRVIASITMLSGIILIALPVGILATSFAEVIKRRDFVISWGMVARVPLFADLDAAAIGEIHKALSAHTAHVGEVIVRRGEEARSMYFIASGEVALEFADETVVLREGQFFGEMALLHAAKRAATVRARKRSMLLALDADDVADIMHRYPTIGQRIRAMAKEEDGPQPVTRRADIADHEIADGNDGKS